jgi:hypothetical protein
MFSLHLATQLYRLAGHIWRWAPVWRVSGMQDCRISGSDMLKTQQGDSKSGAWSSLAVDEETPQHRWLSGGMTNHAVGGRHGFEHWQLICNAAA